MLTLPTTAIATDYGGVEPWLAGRKLGIGASDSAGIFGEGYASQSQVSIAMEKLGLADTGPEECEALEIGSAMQPGILRLAQSRLGKTIDNPGEHTIYRHPELPWLCASLDGVILEDVPAVAEAKYVGNYRAAKEWGEDSEPVLKFDVQCQHQLAVLGWSHAYLVGLCGSRLYVKHIERNHRFINEALLPTLQRFWDLIEEGRNAIAAGEQPRLPETDGTRATTRALNLLYPEDDGQQIYLNDPRYVRAFTDWQECNKQITELNKLKEASKNTLKAAMGSASYAILEDGTTLSNKLTQRVGHWVDPTSYRILRAI